MSASPLVAITARYSEWMRVRHLAMKPEVAGREWQFEFEKKSIGIRLPPMPAPDQKAGDERALATIDHWNSKGEIASMYVYGLGISIYSLGLKIPDIAAKTSQINMSLFDAAQSDSLNAVSDRCYMRARRAVNHWLRVARWLVNGPLLDIDFRESRGSFGDELINEKTNTRFWRSPASRTLSGLRRYTVDTDSWEKLDAALKAGQEPPIWEDYKASAERRIDGGDFVAATLDLAIAAESAVRRAVDLSLPATSSIHIRNVISKFPMSQVLRDWKKFGLPSPTGATPFDKQAIERLFAVRNGLMHQGAESTVTAAWCRERVVDVKNLVRALHG